MKNKPSFALNKSLFTPSTQDIEYVKVATREELIAALFEDATPMSDLEELFFKKEQFPVEEWDEAFKHLA